MSSYIDDGYPKLGPHTGRALPEGQLPVLWRDITWTRLEWTHGADRAALIVIGKDPPTQADIARWEALGRRSAA